jgi:hypothetical protein
MKTRFTFFLFGIIPTMVQAQSVEFPAENINARLNPNGTFFYFLENEGPGFEAPANSGIHAIYTSSLWIGGIDENDTLRLAARQYCQTDEDLGCDFAQGPLSDDGLGTWTETLANAYAGVSIVTADQIEMNGIYWDCIGNPDCDINAVFPDGYEIPLHFYTWPAAALPDLGAGENLAPYYDYNADGTYNPENGDRPQICADIAAYTIFNDNATPHGETAGKRIGLEVHAMMYAYYNSGAAADNTVFLKLKLINRGPHTLHDTYAGIWADIDLGNFNNDHLGSDVARSMYYGYNGTDTDPSGPFANGYEDDLGIIGIRTLAGVTADPDGMDGEAIPAPYMSYGNKTTGWGDGIADNERLGMSSFIHPTAPGQGFPTPTSNPNIASEYYTFLKGIWKDGTVMSASNLGYSPTIVYPTKYGFYGDSDPLFWGTNGIDWNIPSWTEVSGGISPGDRRGLSSTGPFTFAPGDVQYIDYAFIFARDSQNPDEDVLTTLRAYADEVVNLTCENLPDVIVSTSEASQIKTSVQLYPNPSADVVTLSIQPATYGTYTITDLSGRKVASGIIAGSDTRLDLTSFSNGMYIVAIETANTQTSKKLLVGN